MSENWYSNKEIFEMMMEIKEDLQETRKELSETRILIKKYNGLWEKLDKLDQRVDQIEERQKLNEGESKGRSDIGRVIISLSGWAAAIIAIVALFVNGGS